MSNLAPSVQLNNGQRMPTVGLGTWQALKDQAERAVTDAIDIGYRLIDTAFVYGNEREIGRAINRKIAAGIIKREDIFVTTKLDSRHHTPKLVERACRESLLKLSLDYVDQYLIHFPVGEGFVDYLDTWKAMEKLVDVGLAKGIGLSNFNAKQIDRILENCRIRPVVNQVECHPGFNQKKLIEFCRKRNITIVAYSPLGRPIPAEKWPPFLNDKIVQDIAKNHSKTPVQVCLNYLLHLGAIVIPKSVNRDRIAENFRCFDFQLNPDELKIMDDYDTGERLITFPVRDNEKKVGRAINEKNATDIIKREDIFVITKLDSTHHTPKLVERACRLAFLLKLSLDYVDQYLIRFPVGEGVVVIPTSVKRDHIEENFKCFNFKLRDNDIEIEDSYHTGERLITFFGSHSHKFYSFHDEY
ncbi:hypothetical protein GQX74_012440 [Glossina fuscipes]|nr:hypothetical protein GQX74_012440 [Glossina fuscipes]